jgi:uncharacterized membrane protein YfcA
MDLMLAVPGAIAIGLSLGLLGSGGSILTVPVLVYLVGQDEKVAIAGSLFVVGSIALAGGLQFLRAGFIQWRSVLVFGLPGMLGTYLGAMLAAYVITLKSYSGFWKYLDVLEAQSLELDWATLLIVTALGIVGSIIGSKLARRLPQDKLKRGFGWFLIVMGIYILARSGPAALGIAP